MFIPSFSVSQSPSDPGVIVLVDTSQGSDNLITERRVFTQNSVGGYLVPEGTNTNYTVWELNDATISLDVLTNSTAASIKVAYYYAGGTEEYSSQDTYCFDLFSKLFAYSLVQGLVPGITLTTGYSQNLADLWTNIIGAENAIILASDLTASQACLNRAIYLQTNQSLFF